MLELLNILIGGFDASHILIAAVAQQLISWLWFEVLFQSIYKYFSAADKGVRQAKQIRKVFGETFCLAVSFVAAIVRTLAVYAIVKNAALSSRSEYLEAANMVSALVALTSHHAFWSQRPLSLIVINVGHEVVSALTAATVLHALLGSKFF